MPTSVVAGKRWRCECGCREIEAHQKVVKAVIVHQYPDNGAPPIFTGGGQIVGAPEPPHLFRCSSCHQVIAESAEALLEAARDGNAARWQRPIVTANDVRVDRTLTPLQETLGAGAVLQFIQPGPTLPPHRRPHPLVPTLGEMETEEPGPDEQLPQTQDDEEVEPLEQAEEEPGR
jgi:hypothetical protein